MLWLDSLSKLRVTYNKDNVAPIITISYLVSHLIFKQWEERNWHYFSKSDEVLWEYRFITSKVGLQINGKLILLGGALPWGYRRAFLQSSDIGKTLFAAALVTTTPLPFPPNFTVTRYPILWQTVLSNERVYRYLISPWRAAHCVWIKDKVLDMIGSNKRRRSQIFRAFGSAQVLACYCFCSREKLVYKQDHKTKRQMWLHYKSKDNITAKLVWVEVSGI